MCGLILKWMCHKEKIIELIRDNSKATGKMIAHELKISVQALQRILNDMNNTHYVGVGNQTISREPSPRE